MSAEERTLVVLSGGESKRFGRVDKGLYLFRGTPLAKRVIDALRPLAGSVVVQVARGRKKDYGRVVGPDAVIEEDSTDFKGPLSGLSGALRLVKTEFVLLSPCDLPDAPPKLYTLLLSKLGAHDAAVPMIQDFPEPITAVYRTAKLKEAVESEIRDGRLKLSGILAHLDAVLVSESELNESGVPTSALKSLNAPN